MYSRCHLEKKRYNRTNRTCQLYECGMQTCVIGGDIRCSVHIIQTVSGRRTIHCQWRNLLWILWTKFVETGAVRDDPKSNTFGSFCVQLQMLVTFTENTSNEEYMNSFENWKTTFTLIGTYIHKCCHHPARHQRVCAIIFHAGPAHTHSFCDVYEKLLIFSYGHWHIHCHIYITLTHLVQVLLYHTTRGCFV